MGVLHPSFNTSAVLLEPGYYWVRYAVTVLLGLATMSVLLARRRGRTMPRQRLGVG